MKRSRNKSMKMKCSRAKEERKISTRRKIKLIVKRKAISWKQLLKNKKRRKKAKRRWWKGPAYRDCCSR